MNRSSMGNLVCPSSIFSRLHGSPTHPMSYSSTSVYNDWCFSSSHWGKNIELRFIHWNRGSPPLDESCTQNYPDTTHIYPHSTAISYRTCPYIKTQHFPAAGNWSELPQCIQRGTRAQHLCVHWLILLGTLLALSSGLMVCDLLICAW